MKKKEMIRLETFAAADFDRLIGWIKSEEALFQFAGPVFIYPLTRYQLNNYLKEPKRRAFKVVENQEGKVIGHAEIYYAGDGIARLCRILIGVPDFKGKGFCPCIVKALLEEAFDNSQITDAELNVYEWNEKAIACYEKAGLAQAKKFVKEVMFKGRATQVIRMTIDRKKWESQKRGANL